MFLLVGFVVVWKILVYWDEENGAFPIFGEAIFAAKRLTSDRDAETTATFCLLLHELFDGCLQAASIHYHVAGFGREWNCAFFKIAAPDYAGGPSTGELSVLAYMPNNKSEPLLIDSMVVSTGPFRVVEAAEDSVPGGCIAQSGWLRRTGLYCQWLRLQSAATGVAA